MTATVAVIGGGISGLSAAWELSTSSPPGMQIVVLEATPRLGGHLRSASVGGRVVDLGADAFLARRPEAIELCSELGIDDSLVAPGSSIASVWAKGALRPLPDGIVLGVPTRWGPLARSGIISPLGLARAGLDLLAPARSTQGASTRASTRASTESDRSVGEIVAGRLGGEVRDLLVGPLVGGIHAGSADDLSAQAVFPALLEAARKGGSLMRALRPPESPPGGSAPKGANPVFLTPPSGMASLPETLASALRSRGVELLMSEVVERVELVDRAASSDSDSRGAWSISTGTKELAADALLVAVPPHAAAGLLGGVDAELAALIGSVKSASVVLVTLQLDADGVTRPLAGTGFLVPSTSGGLVTACTFLSTKWPHLAREGDVLIRAFAGRAGDDRASSFGDGELVEAVLGELDHMIGRLIGPLGEPRQVVVTRFDDSFPQYVVGHVAKVDAIEAATARLPALALAGSAYHGIGVPACIGSGRRAARHVLGALSMSGRACRAGRAARAGQTGSDDRRFRRPSFAPFLSFLLLFASPFFAL